MPAGGSATLSLVFAWHFPDRDFSHQILGNMYSTFWPDSSAVAAELATEAKLASVVADINSHHYAIASPENPTPVWLKDQLLNQWSHFHMLMWYYLLHITAAGSTALTKETAWSRWSDRADHLFKCR